MHIPIVIALVVLQCTLCLNIRVPVDWSDDSEVNKNGQLVNAVKNEEVDAKPTPNEYFQYPANKPQFAINIAADNGVQSPQNLYKPHAIRHTNLPNAELDENRIQDSQRIVYPPYQGFIQNNGALNYVKPASTSFEIRHPYKSEEPGLQQLYKDPILAKIRNDLRDINHKSQKYQNEAGALDVRKEEYLEKPEQTDHKKLPEKNNPTQFEVHRPQRRPVYYKYPPTPNKGQLIVNHRLKHPWNQHIAKVTPNHYRPIKNHLHGLRQQQALKYDDEHNEYPQLSPQEDDEEKPEGYDIYEKGKAKFVQLGENVDNTINKVAQENRAHGDLNIESPKIYESDDDSAGNIANEEEFIPVKNYAQVRKTEITKHLPREAALQDAENLEEIQNAPRLREAVKSKKAQIVYSEEGYEDSAYDHGGEQKHASDHESHGGYLKQNEISKGKFKTPSFITNHGNIKGSEHRDEILHGKKWNNDIKENEDETESDYYESQEGNSDSSDLAEEKIYQNDRTKRNSQDITTDSNSETDAKNSNGSNVQNINKKSSNAELKQNDAADIYIKQKYPYYFQNLKLISKNSPIRYAENFDFIPKKSNGGTEFYDSRAIFECPEVEDNIDPLPKKLKKDGHPDESDENSESSNGDKAKDEFKFSSLKNNQRLKGLGDKIDCFKAKYFGENPLDNPFFKEDVIENPEPVTKPNLEVFDSKQLENLPKDILSATTHNSDLFTVLDKLRNNQSLTKSLLPAIKPLNISFSNGSNDVAKTTANDIFNITTLIKNKTESFAHNRKKRATPFTYEPYKIIRDSQIPDSKKTTTTSNISPLIKQLQSSRVIDKVTTNQDKDPVIKKANAKVYKNIGKDDRQENRHDQNNESIPSFVDVNLDQRRGEPRFEIRTNSYKSPSERKKNSDEKSLKNVETTTQPLLKRSKRRKTTSRPYFDVSQYLPQNTETQHTAASNTVRKVIWTTTPEPTSKKAHRLKFDKHNNEDEYDEYKDEETVLEDEVDTITSTTTIKPAVRKRTRGTTTTFRPTEIEHESESPKLRLVTRFNEYQPKEKTLPQYNIESSPETVYDNENNSPKYTEKKKKSSKSTLVTDTKSYGVEDDDEDDVRKKEVDDLIGVKHDTDEYLPLYERVVNKIKRMKDENLNKKREHNFDSEVNIYDDDKYPFTEEDDEDNDEDENDDNEDIDENDENEDDKSDEEVDDKKEQVADTKVSRLELTTSEPTKRTLAKTTEAPVTTTESQSSIINLKPIISKKKVEIHKELPVNKSSPHITRFKEDIEEMEITKELALKSKTKPNKNIEALDIYRDEKLAEEINKLGDVEIFRENLDLESGPRHGGNYRSITPEELEKEISSQSGDAKNKDDVETSQTKTLKVIDVDIDEDIPLKRRSSYNSRQSPQKNAKFIELRDTYDSKPGPLHGGNLKLPQSRDSRRNSKSEKYVDIDDEDEEEPSNMHGGNFKKSYGNSRNSDRQMHGGNYRSEKLVKADEEKQPRRRSKSKDTRSKAVSSTTKLPYILDPSKRMYYYVDA